MSRQVRRLAAIALVAGLVVAAAGCSSTGGKKSEQNSGGVAGGKASTPQITIAMVTHAAPGDTFWDLVRKGAEAAAAKDNVTLKYSSDPNAGNQATLVQNAVDSKVDGIAVTLAKPDPMRGAVTAAENAHIPVVGLNDGIDYWKQMGLLEYYGSDEAVAGTAFGNRLNQVSAKHALCVIQEQGNVALETRCAAL